MVRELVWIYARRDAAAARLTAGVAQQWGCKAKDHAWENRLVGLVVLEPHLRDEGRVAHATFR